MGAATKQKQISFSAIAPHDGEGTTFAMRPRPEGRFPTGAELLDSLLVKFGLREAAHGAQRPGEPQRVDLDRTYLLRNRSRDSWVPLEDSVEEHVSDGETVELHERSVAGA